MSKKLIISICGVVALSAAWILFTSSIRSEQMSAYKENARLKSSIASSFFDHLYYSSESATSKKIKAFSFSLVFPELEVSNSFVRPSSQNSIDLEGVQKKYFSLKEKPSFFSVKFKGKSFLVKALRTEEAILFEGFDMNPIINALGYSLNQKNWFVVDRKDRVISSFEQSYIGSRYKIPAGYTVNAFEVAAEPFKLAVKDPDFFSISSLNFLGVLGIFLIAFSLFFSGSMRRKEKLELSSILDEEIFDSSEREDIDFSDTGVLNSGDKIEDMEMLDLTFQEAAKGAEAALNENKASESKKPVADYNDFLMENPILSQEQILSTTLTGDSFDFEELEESTPAFDPVASNLGKGKKTSAPIEAVESETEVDDWVKFAEELSESLEEFSSNLGSKDKEALS